jgi:hypothetical protein
MGEGTVLDASVHPPIIHHVNFVLDSPPRDDIHTAFPCYFVSGRLGRHIAETGLTGVRVTELQVEMNGQYCETHPSDPVPEARLLSVYGRAQEADFGLDPGGNLIVSAAALEALRQFRLEECLIYDAWSVPTEEQMTEDIWEEARQAAEALRRAKKDRS